jgi:hypothetical protein
MIYGAVPGDRCRPASKARTVAAVGPKITDDLQPCLGCDVLGIVTHECPQVPQNARLNRPIQQPERTVIAIGRSAYQRR